MGRAGDDLDCWVYNHLGELVDWDTDDTDYCVMRTPGIGTHRVVVKNLGRATNIYDVYQLDYAD